MNIRIVSDSASDIFALSGTDYASVPLKIITKEKQFTDNSNLNVFEMTEFLKQYKGESKSSCPNVADWSDAFEGCDAVFCITITKNLSGSYNSATLAVRDFIEEDPARKGYVIDTLSAGPECALIIEKLASLIAEGKDFETIKKEINEYKNSTHLLFCLESLRNLANNGRISPAIAKLTGVLGIRMVGKASLEGTLEVISKVRGSEKAVMETYLKMKSHGYRGQKVRIHHCKSEKNAERLRDIITDDYPGAEVSIYTTGALCSFYAEEGGYLVGYEGSPKVLG